MARMARISSRIRGAGCDQGMENRFSMWGLIWEPRPNMNRPSEMVWRSLAIMASVIGLRAKATAMPVLELHRREPAEDRDGYLQLAPVRVDLVDPAVQVGKRAVVDLDLLADGVLHLRHLLAVGRLDPGADLVDLGLAQRRRVLAPDEADHAGDLPHEVPGLVDQLLILAEKAHLDEDVARIQLPDLGRLLAVLNLGDDFRRQQDLKDRVVQLLGRLEPLDVGLHLVLLAGERVKGEPLGSRGSGRLGGHGGFSG